MVDWWCVDVVICMFGIMMWVVGLWVVFWCVDYDYLFVVVWCVYWYGMLIYVLNFVFGVDVVLCIFYNCVKGEVE